LATSDLESLNLKSYPLVLVIWEDANGDATDEYEEKDIPGKHEAAVFKSWGWKVLDTDKGLTLFNEWMPKENTFRARMFIPRGMILKIIELTVSKKRSSRSGNKEQQSRRQAPTPPISGNSDNQIGNTSGELPAP